ncbi:M48 family metalloprotease [bacterium]|nr:M48 family metalloprotease [bacterium]
MKKIIMSLFVAVSLVIPVSAATYDASSRVTPVGENMYTKNGIPTTNVKFMVVSGSVDNSSYATNKTVNVSTNELTFAGNDNEVAAVIGNELGHIISGHASKGKVVSLLQSTTNTNVTHDTTATLVSNYNNTKEEKEADIIAVDLMVNAGYNPLALIVVLTKQTGTYWETILGQPANADRALNIYNYISYAYPAKIKAGYACNEYRTFLTYANSVISVRQQSKKLENKNTKTQAKNKKNSTNKIAKFKIRGGISGWDAAYGLLNGANTMK